MVNIVYEVGFIMLNQRLCLSFPNFYVRGKMNDHPYIPLNESSKRKLKIDCRGEFAMVAHKKRETYLVKSH